MRTHEQTHAQTHKPMHEPTHEKTRTIVVIGMSGVRSIEVGRV
jgi:hypothetical protein